MSDPNVTDMNGPVVARDARGVAVVGNPYSGHGRNAQRVEALLSALQARGLETRTAWTPDERRALFAQPDLDHWCRCVVSAGGDGSLADVINDLVGDARRNVDAPLHLAGPPVAMLPTGNENLFARQFGFTCPPPRLAEAIERGQIRRVDLGEAGGRLFTLMVSAGFDAEVVHRVDQWRRRPDGLRRVRRLSYAPRILACLSAYRYPPITLETDDGTRVTGAHAFVFNIPQYGGNLGIGRHARPDDGQLDWVVFERPGPVRLARYGLDVILARHLRRPDVHHGQARTLRLHANGTGTVPAQADGDPAGRTPLDIRTHPAALPVLVVD